MSTEAWFLSAPLMILVIGCAASPPPPVAVGAGRPPDPADAYLQPDNVVPPAGYAPPADQSPQAPSYPGYPPISDEYPQGYPPSTPPEFVPPPPPSPNFEPPHAAPPPPPAPASILRDCQDGSIGDLLAPGEVSVFRIWEDNSTLPVLTLKNESSSSDFDIYAFADPSLQRRLASGTHTGTGTELITPSRGQGTGYDYLVIKNAGPRMARYRLYCHSVDFEHTAGTVFLETVAQEILADLLTKDSDTTEQRRDTSRGVAAAISVIEGKDYVAVGKDMIINEATMRLHEQLGYGFIGDFGVNFMIAVVRDIFRDY